jgi:PAS domain S-box-containing protein
MNYREKTKNELIDVLDELKQEFEAFKTSLNREIAEREKTEISLRERMKELRCHNEIATILSNANLALDDVVEKLTQIIPDSMQFPQIAGVSIKINDKVFKTQNFVKSKHTLSQQISSHFKIVGHLEVSYPEALLPAAKQIFLPEETDLLFSVAQRIGGFIEKMEREHTLTQNHATLQKIIETINDVIYEISADNVIKYLSPSIEKLVGYKPDELIGEMFLKFVYEPDLPIVLESFALLPGIIFPYIEYRFVAKNGSLCWIRSSASVIFENDKIVGITGSITNITHQKQIETELQTSESLYRSILNASPDVITITDLEGKVLFASPKAFEMFGYDHIETFNGRSILEFVLPEFHEKAIYGISQMLMGNLTGAEEYEAVRQDGSTFNVEINGEFVRDEHGNPQKMIFVTRDISDRKMAEEKLRLSEVRFRNLVESINDVIYEIDSDGSIKYVSPAIYQIIGYDQNELMGRNFLEVTHPDDRPDLINALKNLQSRNYPYLEYRLIAKNGSTRWVRSSTTAIFKDGIMIGGNGSMADITEWKKANDALAESEEKYRLMFFDNPQPMVIYDSETLAFLEVNEAAIKHYGYSRAEFLQLSIKDLHTPDDIANVIEDVELSKNNQNSLTEWKHFGKNKTQFFVELTSHSVNFKGRNARHVLINDITARKLAEEAAQQSSQKWKAIISASPDGIGMISLDGKLQLVSDKLALMYGYAVGEKDAFIGKSVIDFIDPSFHKMMKENIQKFLSGAKKHQINEYIAIKKDNSRFYAELNSTVLFDSDGKPTNILYVQRDITDRKQAENELIQREELLDSIIETARDSIFIKDASLTYIKVNKAMASLFGRPKEEIVGKSDAELFGAASGDHIEEIDRQVLLGETVEEFPSKPVNGEIKHFHTIKVPLKDANGQIYGLCGIARNITESKQAGKALQSSEERFRAISEYSSSSICILNTAGKVIWVNDAMLKMTGYTLEQVYSAESFTAFLAPECVEFVIANFMKFVNHQDYKHHYEFSIIRADGEKRLCEKFMSHYEDQSGKLNLIISMTDITERHHAEQSLRNNRQELIASNNQLEMAQQIGRTGSWLYDIETQKIWGSSEAKRLFGFDKNEEYFTLDAIEACIPECERIHQALIDLINKEIPYDLEYELHPADGSSPKTILSKARAEKDEAGNIISIIGVIQDITDRVSAEQNLVESEEKFRTIAEQTSDFISLSNSNGQIIYASPASVSVFNVTPEDMIGRNFIGFVAESDAARAVQAFGDCLENDNNLKNAEFCLKRADGTMFTAELNASKFHTGTQFGTLVTIRDITERKNSETALQQSEKKFRSIFESIQDTYFEATLEGTLLEISPSIEIISKGQYTRDEMIGKPFAGIYTSPDIRNAYFSQLFNQKRVTDYELLLKIKDGSSIPVSVSAALSFDEEGKPVKITGSLRDITERKVTENALRDSEVRFRSITQQSSDLISITDAKGIITFASSAAESIFRISPREMYGKHFTEFLDEPFLSEAFTEFRIALSKGETTNNFEMRMKRNDGSKFFGEINGSKFQSGTQSGTLVTIRDITERKLAEEALMASEEKYRHLFYNNPQPMWIYDIETLAFLEVNQAAITHYGYSRNEFLSMTLRDIRPPEDIADLLKDVELSKNNQSTQIEWRHIRKNKELRIVEITAQSLIFNGRSARHVLIIDITERKKAEVALRKSEDDLNYAQEIAKMGSWEFNLKTGKVKWSKSYYLLIEQQPDGLEVPNDAFEKMVHPDDKHLIDEKLAEIYQNRKPAMVDLRLIMPGGQIKWVQNNIVPEYDGDTLIALTGVNIDITEKKLAEQEIHDLNENLETKIIIRTIQLEETNEILENEIQSRMLVETELALEKHRLSEIIEGTNVGTWEWNIQTGQAIFNERWAEIIGYTLDELAPVSIETWMKFAHPDDIILSGQLMEKHFKGELAYYSFESRMKHKNGEWVWVLDRGKVHDWDMDHKPLMMSGTHQDITERKKTSEFETELLELSLQLTGIPSSEIAPALNMALQRIGGFLGADRAYIFEMNLAGKTMSNTFEWCNQGINPEIENLKDVPLEVFPQWIGQLQKRENIIIPSVKDLPESWQAEREILEPQGIQSLIVIPMLLENTLIGFVGLDSVTNKREYTASEINILRVWSNMLASLINHQRKEEFIEQTRRNYETFFNTIDDFLFVLDVQGNMIHTNTTVTRRLGYSTDELMEKSVLMVHPAERRGEAGRTVGEMLAGTAEFCPVPLVTKSGEYIPVETRVKHGFWDGRPAIFGVTKDVSQIKLSEEKFSKAFQFNSALMAISDINGQFLDVNDTFLKTLGFLREEVLGNNITPPNLFEDKEFVETINEKMKQGIPVREIESKVTTKSGEVRIGLFSADTIYIGKDLCLLTMMVDITERKQAEEKINQARDEAEKANRAKSEFLSRMSHELRTPMNSILGFAQLMEMGELNLSQKKGVKHILNSGKHLLNLINEVLDIARIEAGRVSLSMEPIHVGGVIMEMLDVMQPNAAKLNLKTELRNSPENKLFVVADHQRLKQVLLNLLANAFKYNISGGSVTVQTALMQKPESEIPVIRISISDTGRGISAENLPKLFQPFERIGAEKGETEGTGLGLTVVKKLIEIMGGTIGVESQPGIGSTFWIELPFAESQKNIAEQTEWALKQEEGFIKKAGTILYIEDNVSNIELVEQILTIQRPGNRLIANMTGGHAVSLAIEYKPDLILLDLDLPDIHGSEVLKNLQAEAKTNAIPVIIISADAMPERIQKLRTAGVKDYLTKPLDIVEFLRVVDEYIK